MNGSYQRRRPPQQNMPSSLLADYENNELFGLLGRKCVALATGVVQVCVANNMRNFQKIHSGPCCFVKDSNKRSYYFRVYNLRAGKMVWEQEFYNQFKYNAPRPYFLTFDTDNCRAALNFAHDGEAYDFRKVLDEKIQQKREKKQARQQSMRGGSTYARQPHQGGYSSQVHQPPPQQPSHQQPQPQQYNFQHNTAAQEVKLSKHEDKKSKKGKKKSKLSKSDIGQPSDFKHVGHVGWDPNKGFDMDNIDPDTRQFFQEAGVTEKDMQDQDKRKFIYDFIEKQGGLDAVRKDTRRSRGAPPPPPNRSGPPPPPPARGGPPPPPQRVMSSSRAPPPPQRSQPSTYGRSSVPPAPPPSRYNAPSHPSYAPPQPIIAPPSAPPASVPPPPPPPPPPSAGIPPPPPPAAPALGASLLSQIQQGTDLKSAPPSAAAPAAMPSGRDALLEAIRKGKDLKAVSDEPLSEKPSAAPSGGGDSLANALALALQKRENAIHTDSESDDSDDDDDDEWSD